MAQKSELLENRFKVLEENLQNIKGIEVKKTLGAFYACVLIDPSQFKDIADELEFCKRL